MTVTNPGQGDNSGEGGNAAEGGNALALYGRISAEQELSQSLFRQALQDPKGALERILQLGRDWELPVTAEEVKAHLGSLGDGASKQWLLKARGGL
jgi:hypothetical protein